MLDDIFKAQHGLMLEEQNLNQLLADDENEASRENAPGASSSSSGSSSRGIPTHQEKGLNTQPSSLSVVRSEREAASDFGKRLHADSKVDADEIRERCERHIGRLKTITASGTGTARYKTKMDSFVNEEHTNMILAFQSSTNIEGTLEERVRSAKELFRRDTMSDVREWIWLSITDYLQGSAAEVKGGKVSLRVLRNAMVAQIKAVVPPEYANDDFWHLVLDRVVGRGKNPDGLLRPGDVYPEMVLDQALNRSLALFRYARIDALGFG